ncbi:trafficking protein particle complex subunit 10 isoform X2 [Prorops nasuta]|uniref:trafficking protein particle complex subunit 10 isoform X2 n=1 Tax=Prorops nasuta TaxID=863751 RepID=UPI0034CE9AA4
MNSNENLTNVNEKTRAVIDNNPIITYAGDESLFGILKNSLLQAIPSDLVDWHRSFSRPVKQVKLGVKFVPFAREILPIEKDWHLINQPIMHIYWSECSDIDAYKTVVKDDIEAWLKILVSHHIQDWMIVIVETCDTKKSTKLLSRATVIDKVKNDFASKNGDRCFALLNPIKSEPRSAESWRGLIARIRHLMLLSYDNALSHFEDIIREQREKRINPNWNFSHYFLLQEELAFVLKMLGLYDEALVQYDELDALFTQFVLNSNVGDIPGWLNTFQIPLSNWAGINLKYSVDHHLRILLAESKASLLDLRSYLFSRQCAMLLALKKPWELDDLGKLCGLMPGNEPSSEQLHKVLFLIAGMGDSEPLIPGKITPTDKLKEALSSKQAFKKQYLEHAELAMGTYKHVNRIRSARLIGKELAHFYSELHENQKSVVFLSDALKMYSDEGWHHLVVQTQLELAGIHKKMDDINNYTIICTAIACAQILHITVRNAYFEEMLTYIEMISSDFLCIDFYCAFIILSMKVKVIDQIEDCTVNIKIHLRSLFPRDVICTIAALSVEEIDKIPVLNKTKNCKVTEDPRINLLLMSVSKDMKTINPITQKLQVYSQIIYHADKSLDSSKVVSESKKPLITRSDSVKNRKISTNAKEDFSKALVCGEIILKPGINVLTLKRKVKQPGNYKIGRISLIILKKLEFLSPILSPRLCFEIIKTQPKITCKWCHNLLAGLTQEITLMISSGSMKFTDNAKLKLRTSRGLTIQTIKCKDVMLNELVVPLSICEPFEEIDLHLKVLAELPPKKDSAALQHKLHVHFPWDQQECILLHFSPPLMTTMKLQTVKTRKYIQIIITGLASQLLQLFNPVLTANSLININFKNLNPLTGKKLIIGNGMNVSFMWELEFGNNEKSLMPIKIDFHMQYTSLINRYADTDPLEINNMINTKEKCEAYKCNFELINYRTLFLVSSKIEAGGSTGEFCRAGSMCNLFLTVVRVSPSSASKYSPQLMYEILADQTMWAVCGRTAGIISLELVEKQTVTLEVMPLLSGYLPLPFVRLSRYIPAIELKPDAGRKKERCSGPRLEPFCPGEVYNISKAQQVHVLPSTATDQN